MAFLNDAALDAALDYCRSNGSVLHICSSEPVAYAAIAAVELGSKTGLTLSANGDGTPDGRVASVPVFSDGDVTATGTASHWALSNGSDTLVATGDLTETQAVTSGNTFGITAAIDIRVADAISA